MKDKARIISAIVMISIVTVLYNFFPQGLPYLVVAVGLGVSYEFFQNFLKVEFNAKSILSYGLFLSVVLFGKNFISEDQIINILWASSLLNVLLLVYLFKSAMDSLSFFNSLKKIFILPIIYFSLVTLSLVYLLQSDDWKELLTILLLVTYGMDTGAWFFGKNFGKTKLWKTVSPNKTVEGFFGGMFSSSILGSLGLYIFNGKVDLLLALVFGLCGGISQLGDLLESKLKRQAKIKDSSNLIPGHGGFYDRVDSLFFLGPFFLLLMRYLK